MAKFGGGGAEIGAKNEFGGGGGDFGVKNGNLGNKNGDF